MKPRYKRAIFWTAVGTLCACALALVIVPPMLNIDNLKPKIESAISEQTGIDAKINGPVRFSLMGGAHIAAQDVVVIGGKIDSVIFSVPMFSIFDLQNAKFDDVISVVGAKLTVHELIPPEFSGKIKINDATINFMDKDYEIISGTLDKGNLTGTVRTDQHKYEFTTDGDEFRIRNGNENLEIIGHLFNDGTASGQLSIDTKSFNEWFDLTYPKIRGRVAVKFNYEWDGKYGFVFSDIIGLVNNGNFIGNVALNNDGSRKIQLSANDVELDLSFMTKESDVFEQTDYDLDISGKIKVGDNIFNHVSVQASGSGDDILVKSIIADKFSARNGIIGKDGARGLLVNIDGAECLFSGNKTNWDCEQFSYNDYTGRITVRDKFYDIYAVSEKNLPDKFDFMSDLKSIGDYGNIHFQFADARGVLAIDKAFATVSYEFVKNKNLNWMGTELDFLPEFMKTDIGDILWENGTAYFYPKNERWDFQINPDTGIFTLHGINIKDWLPDENLAFLNDMDYTVRGKYRAHTIANMQIDIANHTFTGTVSGRNIKLQTDVLDLNSFSNSRFFDDYQQQQFFVAAPSTMPFNLPVNISLYSDSLIYNGEEYANFSYSLKSSEQSMSITDQLRGDLLAIIKKDNNNYKLTVKLNKFFIAGNMLHKTPLNISDTVLTADADLNTHGQIAYDFWHNLSGPVDLSFDNGTLHGIGIDQFYGNALKISRVNAADYIADALDSGDTMVNTLHIQGMYDNGDFQTTTPFNLRMRHAIASGDINISDGKLSANMNLLLRGTSPDPKPIGMAISPDGKRGYSLSNIMTWFDPDFMATFVETHNKF